MNDKKVNYQELAKKALRKSFEEYEYSPLSISEQIECLCLTSREKEFASDYSNPEVFTEHLNTRCPFFKEIEIKENLPILLENLKQVFTEKYENLEKETLKPTQVAFLILVMEIFFDCDWVINNLSKRMENFPISSRLVAMLYVLPAVEDNILEPRFFVQFCNELNKIF